MYTIVYYMPNKKNKLFLRLIEFRILETLFDSLHVYLRHSLNTCCVLEHKLTPEFVLKMKIAPFLHYKTFYTDKHNILFYHMTLRLGVK